MPVTGQALLKNENTFSDIAGPVKFLEAALRLFRHQYDNNPVYRKWVDLLGVEPGNVQGLDGIPFLPVSFFRNHRVVSGPPAGNPLVFSSSGTTGTVPSKHYVADPALYEESFLRCFRIFYGEPSDYRILALLPGYLERPDSSLVYMVKKLIELSGHAESGFYLREHKKLIEVINGLQKEGSKVLLIGVSYALLDLCEHRPELGPGCTVMETGGMKGTRREMLKPELHAVLKEGLGVPEIHSEYGMTELLSQAYSKGDGLFESPPWMKFLIRETDDPLKMMENNRTGGVNVIDLANIHSCSFIATQDLGRINHNNKLELAGRFDHSDIRGCNLMVQGL